MTRAQWLRERRGYLGASEVAAVCGLCPFGSPLTVWASKMGLSEDASSVAAEMGHLFEAPLLSYYARKTGRTLRSPGTLRRNDLPWAAANPDAIADETRNVQAKIVGAEMAWHWQAGVPDYVQVQVQWEMWVAGLEVTDVVACVGGTDYQQHEVAIDNMALSYLIEICGRFWQDHIVGQNMPDIDGSETAKQILARRFPSPTAGMADAVPSVIELARRYRELTKQTGALTKERDALGNTLRLAIGEKKGLKWSTGYVSWKPDKDGSRRLYVHERE